MKLEGHVISARRCVAPPIFMTPPTAHGSADFDELMNLLVPGGKGGRGVSVIPRCDPGTAAPAREVVAFRIF